MSGSAARRSTLVLLGLGLWLAAAAAGAQGLTEDVQLDFATLVAPGSGSVSLTVGVSDDASGTAEIVAGTPLTGVYTIVKGPGPNRTLAIDINPGSVPAGITLGSFTATYDGFSITLPASGLAAPGAQGKVLRAGATLTVDSTVAPGSHTPGLVISVVKE